MSKAANAFRTISEVADELAVQKHVLRFWEVKFPQIRPMKRGGGRRYYRPEDMVLLRGIQHLLHAEGYTIKGVQKILREQGVEQVKVQGLAAIAAAEVAAVASVVTTKRAGKAAAATAATVGGRVRALPKAAPAAAKSAKGNAPDVLPLTGVHRAAVESAVRELLACRAALTKAPDVASSASVGRTKASRTASTR